MADSALHALQWEQSAGGFYISILIQQLKKFSTHVISWLILLMTEGGCEFESYS